jgi:hypothetical protein
MKRWLLFICLTAFSTYWVVNLILWLPWSYSPNLGIALMFTVSPLVWSYGIYQCLRTYPYNKISDAAIIVSLVYVIIAVIADYIFFGIIRNTIKDLYRPTTFYGYGFLISLPFIIMWVFRNKIIITKRIERRTQIIYFSLGIISMLIISALISLKIAY